MYRSSEFVSHNPLEMGDAGNIQYFKIENLTDARKINQEESEELIKKLTSLRYFSEIFYFHSK